ncbi:MAG: ATP synthase F1 subunit gamma [Candidatus Eremiobacterota bacterium]
MPKAREVKKRIKGVENIQEITRAMKLVAAARIKKAENAVHACRPYAEKLRSMMVKVFNRLDENFSNKLMIERDVKKIAIVPVTGDKGLCGAFNNNIFRLTETVMATYTDKEFVFIPIGNKAHKFYAKKNVHIPFSYPHLAELNYSGCRAIGEILTDMFLAGDFDELYFIYGKYVSTMKQENTLFKLLPVSFTEEHVADKGDFLLEPSPAGLLDYIIPKYIYVQIYQIILESIASEFGARLMAMTNATDNADELIRALTLKFYRARQEAITTEIIEVTSGSESIKL